jgi:hypothetical protein
MTPHLLNNSEIVLSLNHWQRCPFVDRGRIARGNPATRRRDQELICARCRDARQTSKDVPERQQRDAQRPAKRFCGWHALMLRSWTNRSWYRPSCARRRFDRWSITATPESRLVSTVLRTRTKVRSSDDLAMAKLEVYSHTSTSTASSIVRRHCNSEQLASDGYDRCQPYDEQPDSNNPSIHQVE